MYWCKMEWKIHHIQDKYWAVSECGCARASVISPLEMWDQVRQTIIISNNKMFSYHLLLHSLTCWVFKVRNLRDLIRSLIKNHWWVIFIFCSKRGVSGKIHSDAIPCFVMSRLIVYSFLRPLTGIQKYTTQICNMFASKSQRGWKTIF